MVLKILHKRLKGILLVYCFLYNRKKEFQEFLVFSREAWIMRKDIFIKITMFYKWRIFRNFKNDNVYCVFTIFAVVVLVVTEKVTTQTLTSWGFNGICLPSKVAK